MSESLKLLQPAALTHEGRARPNNEDWVDYEVPSDANRLARKGILMILADGAGGHERGQEASRTAVASVMDTYYSDDGTDVQASLMQAFDVANAEVYQLTRQASGGKNAMTTLVAGVIRDDELYVAHVGDSRAYLVRGDRIRRLTRDHSWVEEQLEAGVLNEDEAEKHPQRSLITRAIGADRQVEVDTTWAKLKPGDALVLTSDGLTGQMSDDEIRSYVGAHPPQEAAQLMIDEVNRRGGHDNITVVVAKTQPPEEMGSVLTATIGGLLTVPFLVGIVALLVLGLLALAAADWRPRAAASVGGAEPTSVSEAATIPDTASQLAGASGATLPTRPAGSTPTPSAQRSPTATLRSVQSEATSPPPGPTNASVAPAPRDEAPAATSAPAANLAQAPTLLGPEEGESVIGSATFEWEWERDLESDEQFDLHVWRRDQPEQSIGRYRTRTVTIERPPHGNGVYLWRVVVVHNVPGASLQVVSAAPQPVELDFWRDRQAEEE
jgi:serine/threonine protein phosphatase PrpC